MNINKIYLVTLKIPVIATYNHTDSWATISIRLAYSKEASDTDCNYNPKLTFDDIKKDAIKTSLNKIKEVTSSKFYKRGGHNFEVPKSGFSYNLYDAFNCKECLEYIKYETRDFTLVSIEETTFEFNTEFSFVR